MCYSAILPTTAKSENANSDLLNLTRVFNRWMKMIINYGRLDEKSKESDFSLIAKVIRSSIVKNDLRRSIMRCRDHALAESLNIADFQLVLESTLKMMSEAQEDSDIKNVKKQYANQGMTERYRPLTKRLGKEKIRKIGKELSYTDFYSDDAETARLVRRIVEKRVAQTVHNRAGRQKKETNMFRQMVRRGTSFTLHTRSIIDYDARKRCPGTHWKVVDYRCKGKKVLRAKFVYDTYEEAVMACKRYVANNPDDPRPMSAYKCDFCGKWHIGHVRIDGALTVEADNEDPIDLTTAC